MTLFSKINNLFHKAIEARIWLASITVIILILLLALTVNNAREKDMVDLFSRQQLASVQNAASNDRHIRKSGKIFLYFLILILKGKCWREIESDSKIFYAVRENS